ncbi:DUF4429 domain-containing protein [Nonomuraea wenchangensis]|uniref:DUF4429 domain-containing protein n=1 Tax=Nonomuraea wenchangensis TaxID=568860 RepID=UPI003CCB818B
MEFDGQFVTIGHGGLARFAVGNADKRIHISQVASVQIKPAGLINNGFIQFGIPGGVERRGQFGRQTVDAVNDENSVVFRRGQQPQFEALARAIEHEIARLHMPRPAQQSSVADQIVQLWQLVQAGAITREEFEQQKAQILGHAPPPSPQGPPRQHRHINPGHAQGGLPPQHGYR